jgi:chromate transport protein ChrA
MESIPGALGMYGLSLGVSKIEDTLPRQAYALLSGLNAATVGIIALAAVQLSEKAITDKMTRVIVFLAAAAGMMYTALWYLPVLMVLGGIAAVVHDFRWLHGPIAWLRGLFRRNKGPVQVDEEEPVAEIELRSRDSIPAGSHVSAQRAAARERPVPSKRGPHRGDSQPSDSNLDTTLQSGASIDSHDEPRVIPPQRRIHTSWKGGLVVIASFLATFAAVMILRGVLNNPPLLYQLFSNMFLAGTIIFGGGPVVIPLLRDYVVAEGWVGSRDFLIGLAIIQAFPGPNFNFAVYLGGLTALNGGHNAAAGAAIAFLGIFFPGLTLVHGTMGVWQAIRGWRAVKSAVRGVNAAAVGLIYTAVYRLWQIGYIDEGYREGASLALQPWWVVVTATSYVGGMWFGVPPPVAIILGGVMGMIWYGVVTA